MVKQISDNEIYLLIKYIKSVLWRVAKCLSYIEEARCLKVNSMYSAVRICMVCDSKYSSSCVLFVSSVRKCVVSQWLLETTL